MNADIVKFIGVNRKLSERELKRLRNAIARRRLEKLREEKALQAWLTDVWAAPLRG